MDDKRFHVGSTQKQPSFGWITPDLIGSIFFFSFLKARQYSCRPAFAHLNVKTDIIGKLTRFRTGAVLEFGYTHPWKKTLSDSQMPADTPTLLFSVDEIALLLWFLEFTFHTLVNSCLFPKFFCKRGKFEWLTLALTRV